MESSQTESDSKKNIFKKETKIGPYYIFSKVLGKGTSAICKLGCLEANETELVAVKIIDKHKLKKSSDEQKVSLFLI